MQPKQGGLSRNQEPLVIEQAPLAAVTEPEDQLLRLDTQNSSIRTESLERILGDKAEQFFKSMERTLQVKESGGTLRMKKSLVAHKQISLLQQKPPSQQEQLANAAKQNKNNKPNIKTKELGEQPAKSKSKDQQWMIQIFESKRTPKPSTAQLAPKNKQPTAVVESSKILHSIEDCDETPTPQLSNKATPKKKVIEKSYLKTTEDVTVDNQDKLKIKEQTNEELNSKLAQLFYETRQKLKE